MYMHTSDRCHFCLKNTFLIRERFLSIRKNKYIHTHTCLPRNQV